MKAKKWRILLLSLLCFCFLTGGIAVMAENAGAEPTYTEVAIGQKPVAVSSFLGDNEAWEASKLTNDRGAGERWTAMWGNTSNPSADEWVKIDLQENRTIGKMILHNPVANQYARKFIVFGSVNETTWFELARYEEGDAGWASGKVELKFEATTVRYVKISLREKGLNGSNYLVSLANIKIFETDQPAVNPARAYSELDVAMDADASLQGGADIGVLTDGVSADQTTNTPYWSGGWKNGAATDTDELIFDAKQSVSFGGVSLFPRCTRTAEEPVCSVYGFPRAFAVYASEDGENYTLIPGQEFSDYQADISWNDFYFKKPVQARYIKVAVTERGQAGGAYLTNFAEVKAWKADFEAVTQYEKVQPAAVTSSGCWAEEHSHDKACDGNFGTSWVAPWGYSAHKYADDFICFDLGASRIIGQLKYYVADVNVPAVFRVLISENGEDWGVLARVDDAQYENKCLTLNFDSVSARYVRTEIFVKGLNGANYLGGFTEVEAYATDEEEAARTIPFFTNLTEGASVKVTSVTAPNEAGKLTDGITANTNAQSNYWMSGLAQEATVDGSNTAVGFDGFYFEFDEATRIDALYLFPRFDGEPGGVFGFPVDFTIVYSENGQEWYGAGEYKNYAVKAGWNEFVFEGSVRAKYAGVFVQKRGMNGDFYTIEFSEARVYGAVQERPALEKKLVLDTSKMNVTPYTPAEFIYTQEKFELNLSERFDYTLGGELNFTVAGAGEVEQRDGVWYYVFTPVEKGVTEVTITGTPQGKTTPKGELKFSLNAVVKENPDVIVRNYTPDMEYSVGVSFRVDVAELFVYEGKEKLVYGTDRGKLETQNGKTYLVFTASQAGEVTVSVTAMPEGKEDKKVTNAIRLLFKAAPEKPGEQPPVYGPPEEQPSESSGCNSRVGGSAIGFAVLAAGAAVICLRRKKQL